MLFVERKRLAKADACLKYAHYLAPKEDYMLRHLQIVQTRLQKLSKLPNTSVQKQTAYTEYDPDDFQKPSVAATTTTATTQSAITTKSLSPTTEKTAAKKQP